MPKKKKSKRRHSCNGLLCFHGAFATKGAAEAKERKLGKGAFVIKKFSRFGRGPMSTRYIVATQDKSGVPF